VTTGIHAQMRSIVSRCAAIDWRKPTHDAAGIQAAYRRWLTIIGVDRPIRMATDPVEAGIWKAGAVSYDLAANSTAGSWVIRFWAQILAGEIAMHRSIGSLYPEAGFASGSAHHQELPFEWDIAAGWASLISMSEMVGKSADSGWVEAWVPSVNARDSAMLRALSLISPFGPVGPPVCAALALRDALVACGNPDLWNTLAQLCVSQDQMFIRDFGMPADRFRAPKRDEIIDALVALCEPMIAACESGAFAHTFANDEVIVVTSPQIWTDGRRLHRADGPAIAWPQTKVHAWKGVFVPEQFILQPQTVTPDAIRVVGDEQQQAALIDIYAQAHGHHRCMRDLGGVMVHEDDTGRLWCLNPKSTRSQPQPGDLKLVEVVNGTPEPDGSRKTYWLRVPPSMQTAQQAVAWTYGMTRDEYGGLVVRT
jgi:hypothetical protein